MTITKVLIKSSPKYDPAAENKETNRLFMVRAYGGSKVYASILYQDRWYYLYDGYDYPLTELAEEAHKQVNQGGEVWCVCNNGKIVNFEITTVEKADKKAIQPYPEHYSKITNYGIF